MPADVAPSLALGLPSIPNFRDVGGHPTRDGWRVRTGRLYRSVALSHASADDLAVLADHDVRSVFDLRTAMERERSPDQLPPGAEHIPLDVLADSGEADPAAIFALMGDPPRASVELAHGGIVRFYIASYHDMVRLPSARASYGHMYRTLAEGDGEAALVHCTTGKDRTGWAVAALLLFLDVPLDAVMDDYLRSDAEVRAAYHHVVDDFVARGGSRDVIEPLMSVQPRFLEAALDAMRADHGSVEAYFGDGLGLDGSTQAALRTRFLQRA